MTPGRLQRLVAAASAAVPGWQGAVVPARARPAWHEAGLPALAGLRQGIAWRHPEAGGAYAAVRGWGLLVWQPLYLAVIGHHLCSLAWCCERLSQPLTGGEVRDFELAEHEPERVDDAPGAVWQQAASLRRACDGLHARWRQVSGLHARSARRIEADCVLAALLAVSRPLGWQPAEVRAHGEHWLSALGLAGESGYVGHRDAEGCERLTLARRICCLDFRRAGGSLCTTCPRLTAAERRQRRA